MCLSRVSRYEVGLVVHLISYSHFIRKKMLTSLWLNDASEVGISCATNFWIIGSSSINHTQSRSHSFISTRCACHWIGTDCFFLRHNTN